MLARDLLLSATLALACACSGEEAASPAGGTVGGASGTAGGASGGGGSSAGGNAGTSPSGGGEAGQTTSPQGGGAAGANSGGDGGAQVGAGAGGQGGEGGAPIVKENCGSENPAGCYRGMYLSPYTDHIGQVTFSGDDLVYAFILG